MVSRGLAALTTSTLITGCALLAPLPEASTLEQRLAAIPARGLPLKDPVFIHWEAHQIPFVEAAHDEDAALALGIIHAHLRLGQMEILRRISQGRIAEIIGPLAIDIDHGLRILDLPRAARGIEARLPDETRTWLEAFVKGINHYQQNVAQLPHEFSVLGFAREPWTVRDVLAFGRLAGTDVNWLVWFNLLKLRGREDWPRIWARLVDKEGQVPSGPETVGPEAGLGTVLSDFSRSGSNSLSVSASRTQSGGAIIANDPHLGINLPNLWLLAGVKSPSYHAVGLMFPGLPIFAIGRNPWIAWGGTNLRAASSDLYDVSHLDPEAITLRDEEIRVRWWPDRRVTIRETAWGPILSDAPQLAGLHLPDIALRWVGHMSSDEPTAMLGVMRARGFEAFRQAFGSFAVPGQNMLYADRDGNIGRVMAVRLPHRPANPPADLLLSPEAADEAWRNLLTVMQLPFSLNPEIGYLASANDRPPPSDTAVGYFFSPDDRVARMAELLDGTGKVDIQDIEALQQDVYMASSSTLREVLLKKLAELGLDADPAGRQKDVLALLRAWDGRYAEDSRGALAFELFREAFTRSFYRVSLGEQDWAAFANFGRTKALLLEDIERAEANVLAQALTTALSATARRIDKFPDWGALHRLRLAHPLSVLPIIGGRYRFIDLPVGGSIDTLMKTVHPTTAERHATRYGSTARHISDLSDPDLNYFVLLGGQDGWLNSANFLDQVPLWREGAYVQLPLSLDKVRARAVHTTELAP